MRVTVKQPLSFWTNITADSFSGEQLAGSTTNLTVNSHDIERNTGATLVDSYVIGWEILHPDSNDTYTASYTSSNENIATVNAEGVLTVVSVGDVIITVTVTRASDGEFKSNSIKVRVDINTGSSIDFITNTDGSAGKAFTDSLETLISNSDPATAKPRFSSRSIATKTFTRNEDFWGIGLSNLSSISPNNSRGGQKRSGTALTKRHIITTAHYPLQAGDTIDFVANVGGATTAVTRTIQKVKTHPLYAGQSGNYSYDVQLCLLDSDLPSNIDIMEVMPSNSTDYAGQYEFFSTAAACFDQEQKGLTKTLGKISDNIYLGNTLKNHSFVTLMPYSMLNGISYRAHVFDFPVSSDFVSTKPLLNTDKLYELTEDIISGDSGCPNCFVLGSKLVLIGLHTSAQGGTYLPSLISDINQLILDVDTLAGISTGYTVTECDLSSYPTY